MTGIAEWDRHIREKTGRSKLVYADCLGGLLKDLNRLGERLYADPEKNPSFSRVIGYLMQQLSGVEMHEPIRAHDDFVKLLLSGTAEDTELRAGVETALSSRFE